MADVVAFSPDGRWVAATDHGQALIWDAKTGRKQAECLRYDDGLAHITALAFSPGGRWLALGTDRSIFAQGDGVGEVHFWDLDRQAAGPTLAAAANGLHALRFSPDGSWLAVMDATGVCSLWRLPRPENSKPAARPDGSARRPALSLGAEAARSWEALSVDDAPAAYRAIKSLAGRSDEAVAFIGAKLRPAEAPDAAEVRRLIAELNADEFSTRERAEKALERLGESAEPAIRKALDAKPGKEMRRRLTALTAKIWGLLPAGEKLRQVRAIETLALINTADSRRLLEELAGGDPAARITQHAQAALRGSRVDGK
jgi:hypothetical protein